MTRHSSFLYRFSPPRGFHDTAPKPARRWLPAITVLALLPVLLALSSGCCQNDIRRIPTIRGRVVDAKSNKPIADARLARWFEREDGCLAPGGSDVHPVAGSFLAVVSGNDGTFEWPAWNTLTSPIKTMWWYVYHPDWVAGQGWFNHPRPGLDGYFFGIAGVQPWVHLDSQPVGSHLKVTITMEPKDSTAAWEAHFQRLEELTRYGRLDVEYFVKEAEAYAEQAKLSEKILAKISGVGGSLGGFRNDRPCYKADLAWQLLKLREKGCTGHPDWGPCSPQGLANARSFLEKNCLAFRR